MTAIGLIPPRRLKRIPRTERLAHAYCYFLHDEAVRLLKEYESAKAGSVSVRFATRGESRRYSEMAKDGHPIAALRALGYGAAAQRATINTIVGAMASDTLHHIYEALQCLEKRKAIVALNLLRKPLLDNLVYLSWMLADEDGFHADFIAGDPAKLSPKVVGNVRKDLLAGALKRTEVADVLTAEFLNDTLFNARSEAGLYAHFQHAVHLITVDRIELRTEVENFNFIFKNPEDDDLYRVLYYYLPGLFLYLVHVLVELFDRIRPMDRGSKRAFQVRSILGLYLVEGVPNEAVALRQLSGLLPHFACDCGRALSLSVHNAARLTLSESYRCPGCRRIHGFPFSSLFQ